MVQIAVCVGVGCGSVASVPDAPTGSDGPYLASTRPGGLGGMDIWVARRGN